MHRDRVPLLKNEDIIVVPLPDELSDLETKQLQVNLLRKVSSSNILGVVLDVSSLQAMDLFTARKLAELVSMIEIMDVRTVVVGMKPAVALTLTEMGVSLPKVSTALTLEHGLAILKRNVVD